MFVDKKENIYCCLSKRTNLLNDAHIINIMSRKKMRSLFKYRKLIINIQCRITIYTSRNMYFVCLFTVIFIHFLVFNFILSSSDIDCYREEAYS